MGKYIAEQTVKQMIAAGSYIKGARVNVLGLTFKENCADLRNSKVVKGGCVIDVKSAFDPAALASAGLRVWHIGQRPWFLRVGARIRGHDGRA